ncbi:MAG: fluoride efflux transporter CrcB [Candidatus Eremiobacteraeota bacterium]|nr:fluoride efflux transporter CrcB [Candidatus Eremiobacteraeota bacterium]
MDVRALFVVLLGGGIGSIARYAVGYWMTQRFGAGLPLGTFAVNMSGCLIIGLVGELAQTRAWGVTPLVRIFLMVGVLGGYTTFSSFAYELFTMTSERFPLAALIYASASVVLGFAAAYAGVVLGRVLAGAH